MRSTEPVIETSGPGRDFSVAEGPFLRRRRRTVSAVRDIDLTVQRRGEERALARSAA